MLFLVRSGIEETKREDCGLVNGSSSSILDQWAMKNRAEEEGMYEGMYVSIGEKKLSKPWKVSSLTNNNK